MNRVEQVKQKYNLNEDDLAKITTADPSGKFKYIDRIAKWYKDGVPISDIQEAVKKFKALENSPHLKIKDINSPQYDSFSNFTNSLVSSNKLAIKVMSYMEEAKLFTSVEQRGEWYFAEIKFPGDAVYFGKMLTKVFNALREDERMLEEYVKAFKLEVNPDTSVGFIISIEWPYTFFFYAITEDEGNIFRIHKVYEGDSINSSSSLDSSNSKANLKNLLAKFEPGLAERIR